MPSRPGRGQGDGRSEYSEVNTLVEEDDTIPVGLQYQRHRKRKQSLVTNMLSVIQERM